MKDTCATMRRNMCAALAGGICASPLLGYAQPSRPRFPSPRVRPRMILTTDGEIDDRCSRSDALSHVRQQPEFQVEGMICSSSPFT